MYMYICMYMYIEGEREKQRERCVCSMCIIVTSRGSLEAGRTPYSPAGTCPRTIISIII